MPITELHSSRIAAAQTVPDVWIYDRVPDVLRVQISNVVHGALGSADSSERIYASVSTKVAHEHGIDSVGGNATHHTHSVQVHMCLREPTSVLLWLDVVELCFLYIERVVSRYDDTARIRANITIQASKAVEELNERFRRAGFGYRYERGEITRVDSEFLHQEATRPALALLSDHRFAGANDEFRAAHDHLKAGETKDCVVDALKAFESTMKAICDAKGWQYEKGARASDLLSVLRREKLFPEYADKSLDQLLATLKSGLSAVRNNAGGHGQGSAPVDTPLYVAVYALNLAASKIRFLVEAFKESDRDEK